MKNKILLIVIIFILLILVIIGFCFYNNSNENILSRKQENDIPNNNQNEINVGEEIILQKESSLQTSNETKINIAVENKNIKATLDNSETTKDFLKLLPLTIKMKGFYGREYAAGLNAEISTNGNSIDDFENGDVTYYIAGNALAIFYNNADTSSQSGLIRMGKITSDLSDFQNLGDNPEFTITIEEREENNINTSNEENIVLNRYKELEQARIDKDINKLDKIVKDGTTFTHMSGKTQTKQEYFADIENGSLDYQAYTIENPKITIDGNKATIQAKVNLTANAYGAYGTYPFNTTTYFEKINGEWLYRNKF